MEAAARNSIVEYIKENAKDIDTTCYSREKVLAGICLLDQWPNLKSKSNILFHILEWAIVFFGGLWENSRALASQHLTSYSNSLLKKAISKDSTISFDDKFITAFNHFALIPQSEEVIDLDVKYQTPMVQFKELIELKAIVINSLNDLNAIIPEKSPLKSTLLQIEEINRNNFSLHADNLKTLKGIAEQLAQIASRPDLKATFATFIKIFPKEKNYDTAFEKIVKKDLFRILTEEDYIGITSNIDDEEFKILKVRAEFKTWNSGLEKIRRIDEKFALIIERELVVSSQVSKKQLYNIFIKLNITSDPADFYLRVSNLIEITSYLRKLTFEQNSFLMFRAVPTLDLDYSNMLDNFIDLLCVHYIEKNNTVDFQLWKNQLGKLISLAKQKDSENLKFGSHIISKVTLALAQKMGFPGDPERFSEALSDKDFSRRFLLECKNEAKKEIYKGELLAKWDDFYSNGLAKSPFALEFAAFFQGPADLLVIGLLKKAEAQGNALAKKIQVDPVIIAKGYAKFFQKNKFNYVPSEKEIIPFCEDLKPLANWKELLTANKLIKSANKLSSEQMGINVKKFIGQLDGENIFPRTIEELNIIADMYLSAMSSLQDSGIQLNDDSFAMIFNKCVLVFKEQQKANKPFAIPTIDHLISLYLPHLPLTIQWNQIKGAETAFGTSLTKEMRRRGIHGLVSKYQVEAIEKQISDISTLQKMGYSEIEIVIAICRFIQAPLIGGFDSLQDTNLFPYLFEAVIEIATEALNDPKPNVKDIIALFNEMKGRESVCLSEDGKKLLQSLTTLVASPSFAGGRSLNHFRVIAKFPTLLNDLGLKNVSNLNSYSQDPKSLINCFSQCQTALFKSLNVKELMDALSDFSETTFIKLTTPLIKGLWDNEKGLDAANVWTDFIRELNKISFVQQIEENNLLVDKKFTLFTLLKNSIITNLPMFDETDCLEFDIELSTKALFTSLSTVIKNLCQKELISFPLGNTISSPNDEEIPYINTIVRKIVKDIVRIQQEDQLH
jgi:hypothetical protein